MSYPKILIVEDEVSLSNALKDKLIREQYEVVVTPDGERGLNSALNTHPNLIILDMIMPHMGGLEMLKKLRKDAWGVTVPVIILTNVGNMDHAEEITADPYLSLRNKSETSLQDLLTIVKEQLTIE